MKGDAEDGGARFRHPPECRLFFGRSWAQQGAIAAAHQGEAVLNQANGPVAQIVRRPIALGNALGPEQDFCYFAVGTTVHARVERTQGKRQPPASAIRERVQRRP